MSSRRSLPRGARGHDDLEAQEQQAQHALYAAMLGIHAVGQAYAKVAGIKAKSGTKQIDRLPSNRGVRLDVLFRAWVRFVVGPREKIVVAMDWTELKEHDAYYLGLAYFTGDSDDDLEPVSSHRFLSNARHVRTFITSAALDSLIYGPSIPAALAQSEEMVSSVTHDTAPRDGVARPGWMTIEYREDWVGSSDTVREIRMPIYPESGHMVPAWQPAEILEEVQTWYESGD